MRKIFAIMILGVVFGGLSYGFQSRNDGIDTTQQVTDATDEYVYRKLSNGTIVYEPAASTAELVEISPAGGDGIAGAGDGSPSAKGKTTYKYDPLTQTYRRTTVDLGGKSSQDIIRQPSNP